MKEIINLLSTIDLSEDARSRIKGVAEHVKLTVIPTNKPGDISEESWQETEVLLTQGVLPESEIAPNLRWVQFHSAGVDTYVDHPLFSEVIATNMSGAIAWQIGEYVLMTLLAFGQKLPRLITNKRNKHWPKSKEKRQDLMPLELRDSTVGILGYGSIGRQVARLLVPFGPTVLAAKKDVMHPEDDGYIRDGMGDPHGDFFDRLYPMEALHSMLSECDFVVLTLPLTENTRNIIDEAALTVMKPSAYLVNVGRGELIDQDALIAALKAKEIAGAALDVFEEEPLPEDSPLWEMENVIISPHVAGISRHLEDETLTLFVENLNRYLSELPLYNRIDVDKGY
ncbi:MAG: D-2-hydroxyacid dehydrogenase [Brevefilum sp.]|nr:D-2-hydroxyacid dehydrogenase [Brevefilum sp.]MDW7755555.1 D-2-hydroxyacid dehydrogenase [Brevefilum sp.]